MTRQISSFESSFSGFASPLEGLDRSLLQSVAREHSRETVRRFIEQYRPILNRCGRGIVNQLECWLGFEADFASCWHDVFGDARLLLAGTDDAAAVNAAAALALHMGSCGLPGEWEIDLSSPARYRWGRWLLGQSRRLVVTSDGAIAVIRTSDSPADQAVCFRRSCGEWLSESGSPTQLPIVENQHSQVVLLPKAAVDDAKTVPNFPPVMEDIPLETTALWKDAFLLIARHAAAYDAWVQNVVRQIALLETTGTGTVHSSSYQYRDGLIHSSSRSSLMSLAETLVHEASHQYFYLLSRLEPVDDGTDRNTYYSPFAATERPLDRILLAYHACGNILLLYRLCQQTGAPDDGYCAQHEDSVMTQLAQLEAPLHNNSALTWVGRALYDPLVARLA